MNSLTRGPQFADGQTYRSGLSRLVVIALCMGLASEGQAHSGSQSVTKDADKMTPDIERAVRSGKRMLLVELYGTTTYVFDGTHEVAGPMIDVLGSLGFELVLPRGVAIPGDGLLPMATDAMHTAEPDHVFLMNFSKDEAFIQRVISELGSFSEHRVYRMDSAVAEAFSEDWNANLLAPKVIEIMDRASKRKNQ
ncbi:hypothetical protein ABVB72_23370 [Rhizobium nepotum]|uniref:hypothetical protein n=1 Tax=Rhizobium nepotum TaxID=1035271 RepID=UPI00336AA807